MAEYVRDPRNMTNDDWFQLRLDVTEVFSPGAPINEKELFAGRIDQIATLLDVVYQRGKHAVVFGERGVGKTSLTNIFHLAISGPGHPLVIKINCDPGETFLSLWQKVFRRIGGKIDGEEVNLADQYKKKINPDDVQIELAELGKYNPIIIIDEFDRVTNENAKTLMSDTIKTLSDYSVNATVIIVGVAESIDNLIKKHESIARALTQVQMPRMSDEEIVDIIVKGLKRVGMRISEDSIWRIKFYAKGLPYYAHSLGLYSARAAISEKELRVKETHVEESISTVIENIDQTIKLLYDRAVYTAKKDTIYKQVLLACALAETDKLGRFPANAVVLPLQTIMGKRYEIPSFAFHLNQFCEPDRGAILEKIGLPRKYKFRFKDPIYQPFIIMEGVRDGLISQEVAENLTVSREPHLPIRP